MTFLCFATGRRREMGLLLAAGFWLLVSAPAAHALSPLCQAALATPPVSTHYVKRVLDRSNQAIVAADALAGDNDFALLLPSWIKSVASTVVSLIDVSQRLTVSSLSLENATACLSLDSFIIQCQMDKVMDSMEASLEAGSWRAIFFKQSLLLWLNERLASLRSGATDPMSVDASWGQRRFFDPPEPVWCCPASTPGNDCSQEPELTCLEGGGAAFETLDACMSYGCVAPTVIPPLPDDGPLCPYHSDYLPATDTFGCAKDVVASRRAYPPADAEYLALERLMEQVNAARLSGALLLQLQQEIEALSSRGSLPPAPVSQPPPHRVGWGCRDLPGTCSLDNARRCSSDADCASDSLGSCVLLPGFCEGNASKLCANDTVCADLQLGRCITDERSLPVRTILRGPFSLREDILSILRSFLNRLTQLGQSRLYSNELKLPSEFGPGETVLRKMREGADPFEQGLRSSLRILTRTWSRLQAAFDAGIFPRSTDLPLEMANVASALRAPVSRISRLASERTGLRSFVIKYAWYMLRSCIFRPCRKTLELVEKIANAEDCFAYTNGTFLKDTEDDPRWKKCVKDACIRGAGVPDAELPGKCDGIP